MPLTLNEIRRNCAQARKRMAQARAEKWAFGAFNLDDEATLKAVVQAAVAKKSPVLVEVSQGEVDDIGLDNVRDMVDNFKAVPKVIDLELLKQIRESIDCNISLHGGSDTPGHYFRDAVQIGVTKININSDMRYAYRTTLEKILAENPGEFSVAKLINKEVIPAVQAVVESKIEDFNSAGKALV
jgi:fructose/tagatose bisphosphate aldolase